MRTPEEIREGPIMLSKNGLIFSWIKTSLGTVYMAPVKELEKMFKMKIKLEEGDIELGTSPRFYKNKRWNILSHK